MKNKLLAIVALALTLSGCQSTRPEDREAARALTQRGYQRHSQGDFDGAQADYDRAIAIDPYNSVTWNNRGCLYIRQRRLPEAVADLERALELRDTDAHFHNNLGVALQLNGDVESAIRSYDRAISIDSTAANFYSNRGFAHHLDGSLEAALRDLDRAIQLRPGYTKAYYQRAHVRAQLGDKVGAEADFNKYAELVVSEEGGVAPDNVPTIVAR